MQGWISLHRKLLLSNIFQNEKLLKVFIYCLLKASHSNHSQRVGRQTIDLRTGQFIFGRKKAALELDMKESTVRDYMNLLKNAGTIDIKSTNKYSIITIKNWGFYQSYARNSDSKDNNRKTSKGQQDNTNNNGDNDDNVNNDLNYYITNLFDHFVSKKIIQHQELRPVMINAIKARLKDYSIEELKQVIDNYATVFKSDLYFYDHKYTLSDLMREQNVEKFLNEADPLNNFKKPSGMGSERKRETKRGYNPNNHAF